MLAAGGDGSQRRPAMQKLCETYWWPVYGYVRSRTANADTASDLTQGFFAELLERNVVASADPERGRFRAFLLTALKNFLSSQQTRDRALKRGGGKTIVTLDRDVAENRLSGTRQSQRTPEQEFERRWALSLLEHVLERLCREQTAAGREREFEMLRASLTGQPSAVTQAEAARELEMTPEAFRTALHRLRGRYRVLLRQEVAQTVESPEYVDDELQRLISVISP